MLRSVTVAVGLRALVTVAMAVSAAGHPGGGLATRLRPCQVLLDRFDGIGELGGDHHDPAIAFSPLPSVVLRMRTA
jgi:hypothetical protein